MKKILNFLLVRRSETKDKWWHRLALVLIYGSTFVVSFFLAVLIIDEESEYWVRESYTAYSFEKGYQTADGEEIKCAFYVPESEIFSSKFNCGDLHSSDTEFLDRYMQARGNDERLQKLQESRNKTGLDFSMFEEKYNSAEEGSETKSDKEIMLELIQSGELEGITVKRTVSLDFMSFFGNWGIYLLVVLSWILFWESVVYRTILYIVYGRNH